MYANVKIRTLAWQTLRLIFWIVYSFVDAVIWKVRVYVRNRRL